MKIGKIIGCAAAGALLLSAIPYRVRKDKETGTMEVRSLLWCLKKTPGEDKNHFVFAMPACAMDGDQDTAEKAAENVTEEAAADAESEEIAEDAAEESADAVEEQEDTQE